VLGATPRPSMDPLGVEGLKGTPDCREAVLEGCEGHPEGAQRGSEGVGKGPPQETPWL
jgi:hypothetical protein